jgi:hypothetical protein
VVKVENPKISLQAKEKKIRVREGLTETEIQDQNRSRTHRSD